MTQQTERAGLRIAPELVRFIEADALPDSGLEAERFWQGLADIYGRFAPENERLLARRDELQQRIDQWHGEAEHEAPFGPDYHAFLKDIGYLVEEPAPFTIAPTHVDAEIAELAGPQLVVPVLNARFLLNAANARWGSLYDALYGTDALGDLPAGADYDPQRGARVISWAKQFLDNAVPLKSGSWTDFAGGTPELADPTQLVGRRDGNWLLRHHGLHIEVVIDDTHPIGRNDPAHIADIELEAALSTIVDLEDSVAAVDGADKQASYANWLGLMKGDLEAVFDKGGRTITRRLEADRIYNTPDGGTLTLHGRSLLLVRNVGHLMRTPAITMPDGQHGFEGILDAVVTSLIASHDLKHEGAIHNSRTGSIYIVKPKMHGPEEAAFTNRLFDAVEDLLDLPRHTIKVGVMDEERRTSANLAACIAEVKDRIFFINTGFLDRTGDEIHTSMQAGPMVPKGEMKNTPWIKAYEDRNVQIGLACGFRGKAQIGKGMWAAPDRMADMLEQKSGHPMSGANTAWVPSPTAAVLHATHYHQINVSERQEERAHEAIASLEDLLTVPLATGRNFAPDDITRELDNNAQGILGYVVRWVDQGIGCSKVPDINDIGLMEDRATLRISAQSLGNWLLHGICTEADVDAALLRMAAKVDAQNANDPSYRPMAEAPQDSLAFQAARALVMEAAEQPNGYTEPLLHRFRAEVKARRQQPA
ncbi:malate synthase G [Altericroceibacterium endophyticum]|uniref:Malate synthase G n=1 Tax=Altericroceibacterium endophyticum TaxID=1808508 RepID=A0A6I4T847_9SPHN|nr:malate synthase G [Altericroceibacterium endophyticum]MXO66183.1 malate synthase G [Altericroceibacterium endophyticum]